MIIAPHPNLYINKEDFMVDFEQDIRSTSNLIGCPGYFFRTPTGIIRVPASLVIVAAFKYGELLNPSDILDAETYQASEDCDWDKVYADIAEEENEPRIFLYRYYIHFILHFCHITEEWNGHSDLELIH